MAEESNNQEKSKKSRSRVSHRKTRESESSRGRPVPSDKILGHLRAAKKEIDTLSGAQPREIRDKEKSKERPLASGSASIQKPGEVEKTEAGPSAREGRAKETKTRLRPPASQKVAIQGPGEMERRTLPSSRREARIKASIAESGQVRPPASAPALIQKPGEVLKGITTLSKRAVRIKETESLRPLATTKNLVRKPGEHQKFQRAEPLISEPTVERIESNYILKGSESEEEKGTTLKSLVWVALALGLFNLILLGIFGMRTLGPEFAFHDLEANQAALVKEVGDMKYKSFVRHITDTLFKARVLIEVNKDYKEAAKELEKVKMGLNSLEPSLPDEKRTEVEDLLKDVEAALIEVQKGPAPLQEQLTHISTRLNAL